MLNSGRAIPARSPVPQFVFSMSELIRMKERTTARLWMLGLLLCLLQVTSFAQNAPAVPLLPKGFAGWTMSGNPLHGTSPAQADSAHPAVMTEVGLKDFETATYTNG